MMDENTKNIYEKYNINPIEREIENQKILEERYHEIDKKNKELIEKKFKDAIESRFDDLKHYLRDDILIFTELEINIRQVVTALLVESYSASITLTNHIMERLFKLALIKDEVGFKKIEFEVLNNVYDSVKDYNDKDLSVTIKLCLERNLITEEENEYLTDFRKSLRNGFSHYSPKLIFKDEPDTKTMILNTLESEDNKSLQINYKNIPFMQSVYVNKFAEENALPFFDFIHSLIYNIQKRLRIKHGHVYKPTKK